VRVAGVDGCPGGWLAVVVDLAARRGEWVLAPDATTVLGLVREHDLAALAIDIPIGLPAADRRPADALARARLGARGCCVYPAPPRAVTRIGEYRAANARSRELTGKGLSKQAFYLGERIADVDDVITPDDQARVVECHPELSFAELAGAPLVSKKTAAGRGERRELLATWLADTERLLDAVPRPATAADAADALACAWTAERWARGIASRLPEVPDHDERGLRMEIVT
jgi:predicted RNase H-like nuclease